MATLICTRTTCLRTINRSVIAAPITAALTTSSRPSTTHRQQRTTLPPNAFRPSIISQLLQHRLPSTLRAESTSAPSSPAQPVSDDILTWDRYFALRRKRRWLNLGCSVLTSAISVAIFTPIVAQQDFDGWGAQISGLDPIIVLGISAFGIAAGGWLCGPSFGNFVFGLWARRRGWHKGILQKEKSFYTRVRRFRADASHSSPQNSVPDYYGEKIGSVKDYRQWLKDQKAFNLKKDKSIF